MKYPELRAELHHYYDVTSLQNAEKYMNIINERLDNEYRESMSAFDMKAMQYKTITDVCEPVIFENSPFYYETGLIPGFSDGTRDFRGLRHAGGWTHLKNWHLFIDQDPELMELRRKQTKELFYIVCGCYNDVSQHFQFNHRPLLEKGLKGVYEDTKKALETAETSKEKEFLNTVCEGLLSVKRISEKFAEKAEKLLQENPGSENYRKIAESARRCPWEKPQSFYEALNLLGLMRKVIGSLEGIGPNSFGRVDMDLYPFYKADIEKGVPKSEIYDLVSQFLVLWDCHYHHEMLMEGYADHELENTYTLGGCDKDGNPVFNELTEIFLKANDEEKIIFPKIKCRFSANSPKEYLDLINTPVIRGTSTIIYSNDDAVIPALLRAGKPFEDASDYLIAGCWGLFTNCNDCRDDASYTNLLKAFEYQIHQPKDKMENVGMTFAPIDDAASFEEVYRITCENMAVLIKERTRVLTKGGQIWSTVDPLPLFSSTFVGCLESKRDFTDCGSKYADDSYMCVGFPNIVDSLMAIKKLCFDEKKYTLKEFLNAVRCNWEGFEHMRRDAVSCPGWGDGNEESSALAARFNTSLYDIVSSIPGIHGGKIHLGHMTYTEIRFWGEKTLATPDGRYSGDYFSQGLTPSRLKKIPSVTNVINSLATLDKTQMAGNNVINIMLAGNTSLDTCEAFLRTAAGTAMESLQLNCVSKSTLLDAQKHPEEYPDLIVRVCGFSAKFTSLSPQWQQEVLSRTFYEN